MTEIEHVPPIDIEESDLSISARPADAILDLGQDVEAHLSRLSAELHMDRATLVATIVTEWLAQDRIVAR